MENLTTHVLCNLKNALQCNVPQTGPADINVESGRISRTTHHLLGAANSERSAHGRGVHTGITCVRRDSPCRVFWHAQNDVHELEAIALRLEAITFRLEAIAWESSLAKNKQVSCTRIESGSVSNTLNALVFWSEWGKTCREFQRNSSHS